MELFEAVRKRRSVRRFSQRPIPVESLLELADAARLAPSGGNLQPLEYVLARDPGTTSRIFPLLKWAAYIAPRGNPREGERPVAYIILLVNSAIRDAGFEWDVGAAVENILLAAVAKGMGGCWLKSFDPDGIRKIIKAPDGLIIDSVIALGYPAEEPLIEETGETVRYWRDDKDVHHVPKRPLSKIAFLNRYGANVPRENRNRSGADITEKSCPDF